MSRCHACGIQLDTEDRYCPRCGQLVHEIPVTPSEGHESGGPGPVPAEERVLWQGTFSWFGAIHEILVALLLSGALTVTGAVSHDPTLRGITFVAIPAVWLLWFGIQVYRRWSVRYTLTNVRFLYRQGILVQRTHRMDMLDIDDLELRQGIVEILLGVGSIRIYASDASHPVVTLSGIDRVRDVFDLIEVTRRTERRRHAIHVESI